MSGFEKTILCGSFVLAALLISILISTGTPDSKSFSGFQNSLVSHDQDSSSSNGKQEPDEFSPFVDKDGNISRPKDYKTKWSHLGGYAVASKKGEPVSEIHDVYTQAKNIEAFNKTGKFPDGAVLVKEVRNTSNERMTTGLATWSTEIKVWFVMIKDSKDRFPDNKNWGNGWGWALFEAKDPAKNVSKSYKTSCLGCHVPAKDDDWIYVEGYPELQKKAKQPSRKSK